MTANLLNFVVFSDYKVWKAHEYRVFFFYISLPLYGELVNRGLMSTSQKEHWEAYVVGVSLLNSDKITEQDLLIAQDQLMFFVKELDNIYGIGSWTHNVHLTVHLPEMVRQLGPLWAVSMFKNEGFNRTILASFNGSRWLLQQIASRLALRRSVYLLHDIIAYEQPLSEALNHGLYRHHYGKTLIKATKHVAVKDRDRDVIARWYNDDGSVLRRLESVQIINFGGDVFGTYSYYQSGGYHKNNSYIYSTFNDQYGQIRSIVIDSDNGNVFLIYSPIEPESISNLGDITIKYGVFNATTHFEFKCDLVRNCRPSITVPMNHLGYGRMFIAQRVNNCESN